MNRIFIISLLALMLLQTFSKVLLVVDYHANKEYIIEFLCINRDKPELECEGKCHLSKNLAEQEKNEKQNGGQHLTTEVQINLFCQTNILFQFAAFAPVSPVFTGYVSAHTASPSFSFFHPPKRMV